MTFWTLIRRSVSGHWRSHLGALIGAIIAAAALTGALIVGDSVRGSLRNIALQRLGQTHFALPLGDRLVRTELPGEISSEVKAPAVGILQMPASATAPDSNGRANQVQVLGVDPAFWQLAHTPTNFAAINPDSIFVNHALAAQLKAKVGDTITLRVRKPSQLSQDAPLAPTEDSTIALRLKVELIVEDAQFGRFSLQASQLPPLNAFVSQQELQRRLGLTNRVNLVLIGAAASAQSIEQAIKKHWRPADAQLEIQALANGDVEMRSPRVFIEEPVSKALLIRSDTPTHLLTYLVNELRSGANATPYSMVTGAEFPFLPATLAENEIAVNEWLAEDLKLTPGSDVSLRYYVVGPMRHLIEQTNTFTVKMILPMTGRTADPSLMPDFPGLSDADNCRDWDTGFAINTEAIRPKDEKYWDDHRGTPKAFVSLFAAQKMWGNRFGDLTAVRFHLGGSGDTNQVWTALHGLLKPAQVGLHVEEVRAQAVAAANPAQDFGQLFLGFSFFLIATALMLMALLFQLGLEQRAREVGALLALGFEPKRVRRLLLGEGLAIAAIGCAIGAGLGVLYARAMLHGLRTVWSQAIGGQTLLEYHGHPATLLAGAGAGLTAAALALWLTLRKQGRQSARSLLDEGNTEAIETVGRKTRWANMIAVAAAVGALAMIVTAFARDLLTPPLFFGAGALLLIAALLFCRGMFRRGERVASSGKLDTLRLGFRNVTRRPKRSLASVALLACGAFVVASIGVFRLDANLGADARSSGTGGFAFMAESSIPISEDLSSQAGREFYNLDPKIVTNVSFVQMRVRAGDDASCLNLNRAQRPRLVGVNPALLESRGAFTFSSLAEGVNPEDPWLALNQEFEDKSIAAIGDANSIRWALGSKVGATLPYTDEQGRTFNLRIVGAVANSILQGTLFISEANFTRLFPNESGYRMFLIDAPSNAHEAVAGHLTRAMADAGMEVVSARERLAAFNAVQNTYLSTFQLLGGLGLILGSAGLAVILLRNVLERQAEFAVMQAVGFEKAQARFMTLAEHSSLLVIGLLAGVIPAVVAVVPAVMGPGGELPWRSLGLTLLAVLVNGLFWTWVAARIALRRPLLEVLRNN